MATSALVFSAERELTTTLITSFMLLCANSEHLSIKSTVYWHMPIIPPLVRQT